MTEIILNSPAAWSARAAAARPHEAVCWTESGQRDRFTAVLSHLDMRPLDRVLDFGCGTGAFSRHVPVGVDYVGFDWASGMVARAAHDHPGRGFTDGYPVGQYDHVVAIGCFNLPGSWSKQHTFHSLRHLFDTTGCRTLIVSLYAGDDERCLSYTEDEVEACGRHLGYGALVVRHRHNDLLLVARR